MGAVPLPDALDERSFGGKAVQLGAVARAGLPVPPGVALSAELVDLIAAGEPAAVAELSGVHARLREPLAVRSSGVGEDSAGASFAGQHVTRLGVGGEDALAVAVKAVWASARTESALAYRERMGIPGEPAIAAVVQTLVAADAAGVCFTRNPLDGSDELVVEASWGLGEAVVAGLVIPDRFRIGRDGAVLERTAGVKEIAIEATGDGGTVERAVDPERATALCLDDAQLGEIHRVALAAEDALGGAQDVEFALCGATVHLLQSRPVTRFAA